MGQHLQLPGKEKAKTVRRGPLCTKAEAGLGDVLAPWNPQEAFLPAFNETQILPVRLWESIAAAGCSVWLSTRDLPKASPGDTAQQPPAGFQPCRAQSLAKEGPSSPTLCSGMLFVCDSRQERGMLSTEHSCPAICSRLITVSFVPMAGRRDHYQLRNTGANNSIAPHRIPAFSLFRLFGSITAYTNSHQLLTPCIEKFTLKWHKF